MQSCPLRDFITPWPLQPNEIMELAQVIEAALEHFNQVNSSSRENYLTQLRVILHCYYLVQIELGDSHFFSSIFQIDVKENPELIASYALNVADMVNAICDKVRLLDYPWFYPHFTTAVRYILSDKIAYLSQDLTKAHHLLGKIIHFSGGEV
jgi:hypothetical protein